MSKVLAQTKAQSHQSYLQERMAQVKAALPSWITPDRMLRVVLTQFNQNPALIDCEESTVYSCMLQCAQMGLEPGGVLGHAYFIPFKNKKKGRTDCTLIIGYRGLIDLSRRSGQIVSISARPVYEKDRFEYSYGLNDKLEHTPAKGDRGKVIYFYGVAKLTGEGHHFEVMSVDEVNKIRDNVRYLGPDSPWKTYYIEMGRKTLIRRLFKYLPASIIPRAAHEALHEEDERFYDTTASVISEETQKKTEGLRERLAEAQEPQKEPPAPTPPEENKEPAKRRGRPPKAKPEPESNGPFVMTDKMIDAIQDKASEYGWKPEDLREWVQGQYSCGLKGIASQIVYDEIMHFIQDVPEKTT